MSFYNGSWWRAFLFEFRPRKYAKQRLNATFILSAKLLSLFVVSSHWIFSRRYRIYRKKYIYKGRRTRVYLWVERRHFFGESWWYYTYRPIWYGIRVLCLLIRHSITIPWVTWGWCQSREDGGKWEGTEGLVLA